jgi:hypothetical protein
VITNLLNNLTNILINVVPCLFIIGVAILAIWTEFKSFNSYKKDDCELTENAIKFLEQCQHINNNNSVTISTQKVDTEIIEWLFKYLDGQHDRLEFTAKLKNDRFVLLSYPSVLSRSVPRSPVYFAPTLLTALGIFGTFLGISLGIGGVDLDNIKDPQALVDVSTNLLGGMKLAFLTSLFGLLGAIPLMFILAHNGKQKEKYRDRLRKRLNNIAFLETSERLLSRLDNTSTADAAKILEKVAKNLEGLSEFNPDAIGNAVKKAIASEESLLVQELKTIRELQQTQGQTVDLLVRQLRTELIEPVVERLDRSADLTNEASLAVRELKSELGGVAKSLTGAVETIQTFQKDTLVELQQFATSLQIILKDFREETQGVLEQVGSEINEAVSQSVAGMEAQRQAFAESANKASKTFRGIREDLQSALSSQAEQQKAMLEGVESQTRQILLETKAAFQDQSNTLKTVGQEASGLMNQAKENLLGTLGNIDEMLQNTRVTVQQELERFRLDYQAALSEFFSQQNNLLNETLGQQREGLAQVVASLQHTFDREIQKRQKMSEQLDESLAKIGQTIKVINNLVSAVGMNSSERLGQLQEIAGTVGNEAHRVEKAYQNMTNQFNEALIQGNKQLFEYLQQANQSYTKNIEDTDSAAAEVCSKLNETSHGLMNVAEYLVAAANDLKSGNGSK